MAALDAAYRQALAEWEQAAGEWNALLAAYYATLYAQPTAPSRP